MSNLYRIRIVLLTTVVYAGRPASDYYGTARRILILMAAAGLSSVADHALVKLRILCPCDTTRYEDINVH